MISYDLELSELFLEELKRIYKIENNFETYKYFISRFLCSEIIKFNDIKKNISNIVHCIEYKKNIVDYTLNELDLITNSDHILYKDVPISIYGSGDNSIVNTLIEMENICLDLFNKDEFFKEIISIARAVKVVIPDQLFKYDYDTFEHYVHALWEGFMKSITTLKVEVAEYR